MVADRGEIGPAAPERIVGLASQAATPGAQAGGMRGAMPGEGAALAAVRSPKALQRTFASLAVPAYRYLWIGMLFQMGAMQMQMMARGFFIYDLTGRASLLGIVTAASAVPAVAFGLYGGVLADRIEKKRLIQAGQAIGLLSALFIAVSISTGTVTWQHLLAVSFVQGGVMALMMPARQAIVPQLVGPDRLMNAIALNTMGMSLMTMAAPAVAGGVIAAIGVGSTYYLMVGLYVGSMLFTVLLPTLGPRVGANAQSARSDLIDGLRYVRRQKTILLLLVLAFASATLAMPIRFILPIFAKDVFEVGSEGLGGMLSAIGVGSLVGAIFVASLQRVGRRGLVLGAMAVISGATLLGFAAVAQLLPIYAVAIAFMIVTGMVQSARMTLNNTLVMERAEPEYRGRVMSVFMISMMIMPAGVLPITVVSELIGPAAALAIMAGLLIAIAGSLLLVSSRLRQLQ